MAFGGVTLAAAAHPNKMKFKGVLVRLDEPSDKPPSGSNGHKILVSTALAKARLSSIKGMGLNYSPSLDAHAQRRKVGVIEKAWIDGRNLCVEGTIWKHDFPEAEHDLKQAGLGMSMEIGDVEVEDQDASVWKLSDFQFLGATILFRNAAAYHKTLAIAASKERKQQMTKAGTKKVAAGATKEATGLGKQEIAQIAAEVARTVVAPLAKAMQRQTSVLASFSEKLEEMELDRIAAGTAVEDDVDAEDMMQTDKFKAAEDEGKHKESDGGDEDEDDEEDDMESAVETGVDKGELEDMGPDLDEPEEGDEPGDLNKNVRNHGSDTKVMDKEGPDKNEPVLGSASYKALKKRFAAMAAQFKQLADENKILKKKMGKVQAQVIKASSEIGRRSMSPEISSLLRKANYDPQEIFASGQPLKVEAVDAMLKDMPGLSIVDRMNLKNKLLEAGAMEQGVRQ